jgi:hypothetical protein
MSVFTVFETNPRDPSKKKMTAAQFEAFVTFTAVRYGWPARKLADALDISENTMTAWRRTGAPRHVALACAALAFGLPAWRKA